MTPVTISTAAKTDAANASNPNGTVNLNNYSMYDLQVSISADDHWAGSDIRAQINNGGTFFAAQPSDGEYSISFKTSTSAPLRYLGSDTALIYPGFQGGFKALGSSSLKTPPDDQATFPSNGTNVATGRDSDGFPTAYAPANDQKLLDASWGDTGAASGPSGVQSIARLTFPFTAGAIWVTDPSQVASVLTSARGQVKQLSDATARTNYAFYYGVPVPEPTSIAMLGLGLGAVALRRRK